MTDPPAHKVRAAKLIGAIMLLTGSLMLAAACWLYGWLKNTPPPGVPVPAVVIDSGDGQNGRSATGVPLFQFTDPAGAEQTLPQDTTHPVPHLKIGTRATVYYDPAAPGYVRHHDESGGTILPAVVLGGMAIPELCMGLGFFFLGMPGQWSARLRGDCLTDGRGV